MSMPNSRERTALQRALTGQRDHILSAVDGLSEEDLRRPVLPSGWNCLGLVQHLTYDVEQFWFRKVMAAEPIQPEEAAPPGDAWKVAPDLSAQAVLAAYRREIARSDAVIAATALDAEPAWWPAFFPRFLDDLRSTMLHVIGETACHSGHLDAVRELIDGTTHLVLT
jgi:hypothetical protein